MTLKSVIAAMVLLTLNSTVYAGDPDLRIGRFSAGDLTGWKEQTLGIFKNKTVYTLTRDNERMALLATSKKSASGLIHKLALDAKERPIMKWSWKIDHIIKKGDERTKDGDDFAARVYVIFPRGLFSKMRAISYVWANKLPKGQHINSPFSANVVTVAVDSGEELAGHWTYHQRNIYDDYKTFFNEEPPKLGGIAVMTDTDNTGESATAYYGDITLTSATKSPEHKNELPPKEQKPLETPKEPAPSNPSQPAPQLHISPP